MSTGNIVIWETQHTNARRSCLHFRKPHFRANKLVVLEQISFSHSSTEAEVISLDAGLRMDGIPANETNKTKDVREQRRNLSATLQPNMRNTDSNHAQRSRSDQYWSRSIKRNTFWFQRYVVLCLWEWGSRDSDDSQRPKSHNETCVQNPQSCFGLVI